MTVNNLVDLLTLESLSDDPKTFTAPPSGEHHIRAFGGRTFAQAMTAAGRTVPPNRRIHSVHGYFLRPGDSARPMECRVEVLRDGRSFSSRRVVALQNDKAVLELMASFHTGELGPRHTDCMPSVANPNELLTFEERFAGRNTVDDMGRWFHRAQPFDIRYVEESPFDEPGADRIAAQRIWFKAKDLPRLPGLHEGALAYASDMTILDPVLLRHGMRWTDRAMLGATLDHTIWFHQQIDFNEWILFDQRSSQAHSGRALATANLWNQEGALVATVAQEALMRPLA